MVTKIWMLQNPLTLPERGHLGISQGSFYINNLSLACSIFMKIGEESKNNTSLMPRLKCQNFENVFLPEILGSRTRHLKIFNLGSYLILTKSVLD